MDKAYIVHSSNFFGNPPHSMIVSHSGTQYSIHIPLHALVGTRFNTKYTELLAKLDERDENGLPKHSPFEIIEFLREVVRETCASVSDTHANIKPENLQDIIQPPTLHLALAKDANHESGVVAKVIGDHSSNFPWDTSRAARTNSQLTNSYCWDIAPVPVQYFELGPRVETFQASELFINETATQAGLMQQVHNTTGTHFFFKPRLDLMAPEFDREVSVLDVIASCGLDKTLKVSPFKGLVVLDNSLVVGMLFGWIEGVSLAEHPDLTDPSFQKLWKDQVEAIVEELHRHKIVWGDVNVHNIFIDGNGDAWVVDFGGNCNVQFVDEEFKETYKGDLQGLRRVFDEWAPAQRLAGDQFD